MSDYLPGFLARVQDWYRSQQPNDDRVVVGMGAEYTRGYGYDHDDLSVEITFNRGTPEVLYLDDQESLWRFLIYGAS